jgi:hypothetical protein
MEKMLEFYSEDGKFGIDPGLSPDNKEEWVSLGLEHLLH